MITKYTYSLEHIRYTMIRLLIPIYFLAAALCVVAEMSLGALILFLMLLCVIFCFMSIWWHLDFRPDITGEWIIDEENGVIKRYRPKKENKEYEISKIEEIRYARDGVLYIKLKEKSPFTVYFKILAPHERDFEKDMQRLAEKYGFGFKVLKKRGGRRKVITSKRG